MLYIKTLVFKVSDSSSWHHPVIVMSPKPALNGRL